MSKLRMFESVGNDEIEFTSYDNIHRHHPSTSEDVGVSQRGYEYATVDGKREQVKNNGSEVVKDFYFKQQDPGPVRVPSPVNGYAHPVHDDFNSVFLYDKPFGTPGATRIGAVLHMERGSEPKEGERLEYGKPMGIMGDVGSGGSVHVHMQLHPDNFRKYIDDIAQGRIQSGGVVTATAPTNTAAVSPDSGTLKDTLLTKSEQGEGVKRLQEALNKAGIQVDGQPLPATGYFGEKTEQAVKQYQQQKGLEVDGKAGKDTLTALGIYPGQQQNTPQPAPTQQQQTPTPQNPTPQNPTPTPTQQTNPYGFGQTNELGKLIGGGEGGYNSYNRGVAGDARGAQIDFSQLTVGEVMRRQDLSRGDPDRLFAVGKYQFTPDTLQETVNALGIDKNAKFTPQLQEKMFADYLIDEKRPQVKAYITGQTSGPEGLERAQHALALEFASVGDPRKGGRGAYDGDSGGNSASIKTTETATALNHMREQYQKNIQAGQTPDQAYRALSGDPNAYTQSSGATSQTRGQGGGLDDKLLVKGEDGAGVKRLQESLNAAGIKVNGQPLPTTGHFGDMTEQAVRTYQQQKGLEVDGKAGKDTLTSLGIYPGQQQAPANPAPTQTDKPQTPANAQTTPTPTDKPQTPANVQPTPTDKPQTPANVQPAPTDKPQTPPSSSTAVPPPTQTDKPLMSNPNHPDNKLYQQAVSNLEQLGPSGGFKSREDLEKAAAAVAADAKATGLKEIDHISKTNAPNGQTYLVAVQGDPTSPAAKNSYIDYNQATNQTMKQSTEMADAKSPAAPAAANPATQQVDNQKQDNQRQDNQDPKPRTMLA